MTTEFIAVSIYPLIQKELTGYISYLLQITPKLHILKQQTLSPSFLMGHEYRHGLAGYL